MRNLDFAETLEVVTFCIALALFGWAADRSHELLAAVGMFATQLMFILSVCKRGN